MAEHNYVLFYKEFDHEKNIFDRVPILTGGGNGYSTIVPMSDDVKREVLKTFPKAKNNLFMWLDGQIEFRLD